MAPFITLYSDTVGTNVLPRDNPHRVVGRSVSSSRGQNYTHHISPRHPRQGSSKVTKPLYRVLGHTRDATLLLASPLAPSTTTIAANLCAPTPPRPSSPLLTPHPVPPPLGSISHMPPSRTLR